MLNKKIQLLVLLLQALSRRKDMVAMSGSGPGYMQIIIITPYVHNKIYHVPQMMKKHGSLRSLVDKVFLSIYISKYIEHGKLNDQLFHDIRNKWIHKAKSWFSKLWLFKQKLSPHNTIQIPFWWIFILSFILRRRDKKWWPESVFSPKEQLLGCSHQPSPSWKTPKKNYEDKNGWNGGMKKKKGMKRSKWEEFEQHHQFKLTRNP